MARQTRGGTPKPSTLLVGAWYSVLTKINTKLRDEVEVFCPFTIPSRDLIQHSVPEDVLDILRKARQYRREHYSEPSQGIIAFNPHVNFTVDFAAYGSLVPMEDHIVVSPALRNQLQTWYNSFIPFYRKWMLVRHVASWFNNAHGATVAGVRYYWPSMMALLHPGSGILRDMHMAGVGTHQKEPKDISSILPLCRETASTVTAGQLLAERASAKSKINVTVNVAKHAWNHIDYTGRNHAIEAEPTALVF